MHRPAEASRKIPNPVRGYRAGEISIMWGLQPFKKVVVKNIRGATSGVSEVDRP
jgi:hypothetical protein